MTSVCPLASDGVDFGWVTGEESECTCGDPRSRAVEAAVG